MSFTPRTARAWSCIVLVLATLSACDGSDGPTVDGGALTDARADVAALDARDPLACATGEFADWYCIQGDPETHTCTDSMWPPSCVDGRWSCTGTDALPDFVVDCWCSFGPPAPHDWPDAPALCSCTEAEGYTCRFGCGPEWLCTVGEEWCRHTLSDVTGVPDAYECRPFDDTCSTHACDCWDDAAECELVENGGVERTE